MNHMNFMFFMWKLWWRLKPYLTIKEKILQSFSKAIVSTIYLTILFIQFWRLHHNSHIENLFCKTLHRHFQVMRCLNTQKVLKIKYNRSFNLFFVVNVIQFLSDPNAWLSIFCTITDENGPKLNTSSHLFMFLCN